MSALTGRLGTDNKAGRLTRQGAAEETAVLFLRFVGLYSVLQFMAIMPALGVLKLLSHLVAGLGAVVLLIRFVFVHGNEKIYPPIFVGLIVFYWGILGVLLFNGKDQGLVDLMKVALVPIFLLVGIGVAGIYDGERLREFFPVFRRYVFFLLFVPFLGWAVQSGLGYLGYATAVGGSAKDGPNTAIGYFINRNNFAFHLITLLALYNAFAIAPFRRPVVMLSGAVIVGALGGVAAVAGGLLICVAGVALLINISWAVPSVLLFAHAFPDIEVFQRINVVIESIRLLVNGTIDLATVTYAELFVRLNTTDLSFLFRLKHWLDILTIYFSETLPSRVFGMGVGASENVSAMRLVPHNDYIRLIVEFGAVTFVGFILMVCSLLWKIGRGWTGVPFFAAAIYFFSENLVNNFTAMALLFFAAGVAMNRKDSG